MSDEKSASAHDAARRVFGVIALFLGIGLFALVLIDATGALPFRMPRMWYVSRPLWILIAGGFFAAGWKLQLARRDASTGWKPSQPGRRFHKIVVYSRPDCHLCDDAKAVLAEYADYLPDIEDIDIDRDPDLVARFGATIPVVECDGVVKFHGRVDELLLRRLIEGTPPIDRDV